MKTKVARWMIVVGFSVALNPGGVWAKESPQKIIQNSCEQVREILKKKVTEGSVEEKAQKEKLKVTVDTFLDYRELALRSLGPHWGERSAVEQRDFVQLLRDLIEASYTNAIRSNIDFQMKYETEEIEPDGASAAVVTVASAKNRKGKLISEDLTFQLYLKDKNWMVYDIVFGDLSLVRHYRTEFHRKITKESYAALLSTMKKKLDEVKAGKIEKKMDL